MRAGCTACVQDEAICMADARLRKGVYAPKGIRGVYTYTGSHSKTVVFGLITLDGEGFFQRYGSFTGKEFVEFLKAACERFGKILMITDGAPQHGSKFVREELAGMGGLELALQERPDAPAFIAIAARAARKLDAKLEPKEPARLLNAPPTVQKVLNLAKELADIEFAMARIIEGRKGVIVAKTILSDEYKDKCQSCVEQLNEIDDLARKAHDFLEAEIDWRQAGPP